MVHREVHTLFSDCEKSFFPSKPALGGQSNNIDIS